MTLQVRVEKQSTNTVTTQSYAAEGLAGTESIAPLQDTLDALHEKQVQKQRPRWCAQSYCRASLGQNRQ